MLKLNEFLSRKGNAPNCEARFGLTARGEFNLICFQSALDFMKVGFGHRSPRRAYLNSRTLIDIIPSQVLTFLSGCNALDMDMVLLVVRPPVADSIAAA